MTNRLQAEITAHVALGDRETQRHADLLRTSLFGDSPAERDAAAAELARIEATR
jgi:hypothetical protein